MKISQINLISKRALGLLLAGCLIVSASMASAEDVNLELLEQKSFQQAIALAEPAVVRIQTFGGLDRVGGALLNTGPTTGVIVSKDGYVLTSSFNFVGKPASILVVLKDGRRFSAKLVSTDNVKRLTLLKIEAKNLPVIEIASKKSIQVGQWAIALGRTYNPETPNVSIGIISAKNRVWGKAIQVDAKISPTNYGGPVLNISGKMVALLVPLSPRKADVSAGVEWYDSGIGFAIPAEEAFAKLPEMKKGKTLLPGLLGVSFYQTSKLGDDPPKIRQVRIASPASDAGLKKDDLILTVAKIKTPTFNSLKHVVMNKYAGEEVELTISRDKKTLTKKVKLVASLLPYEAGFLGILPDRPLEGSPNAGKGVKIRHIIAKGAAEASGLKKGDLVTKLNETVITSADQLAEIVRATKPKQTVRIEFSRDGKSQKADVKITPTISSLPEKLQSVIFPPGEDPKEGDPKQGRVTFSLKEFKSDYWAWVPESYNENLKHTLVVWLHPAETTMEAKVLKQWQSICNERGIIILAPKAKDIKGWTTGDLEAITEGVKHMKKEYNIDENRVLLMGYQKGAEFAFTTYFRNRELFQGVIAIGGAPRMRILENSPEFPVQIAFVSGEKSKSHKVMVRANARMRKMKYPTSLLPIKNWGDAYPADNAALIKNLMLWIDTLDRI